MALELNNLSLRDAIAYEFFMDNIGSVLDGAKEKGASFEEVIVVFAKTSFVIADIFCEARDQPTFQDELSD